MDSIILKTQLCKIELLSSEDICKSLSEKKQYSEIPNNCLLFEIEENSANHSRSLRLYQMDRTKKKDLNGLILLNSFDFFTNSGQIENITKDNITLSLLKLQIETTEDYIDRSIDFLQVQREIDYLKDKPKTPEIHYLLGLLYEKQKNHVEAFKNFLKADERGDKKLKNKDIIYEWDVIDSLSTNDLDRWFGYFTSFDTIVKNELSLNGITNGKDLKEKKKLNFIIHNQIPYSFKFLKHLKKVTTLRIECPCTKIKLSEEESKVLKPLRIFLKSQNPIKEKDINITEIECK